jgi:hypothetical protein
MHTCQHEGYNAQDGNRYCCYCGARLKLRPQDEAECAKERATYNYQDLPIRMQAEQARRT